MDPTILVPLIALVALAPSSIDDAVKPYIKSPALFALATFAIGAACTGIGMLLSQIGSGSTWTDAAKVGGAGAIGALLTSVVNWLKASRATAKALAAGAARAAVLFALVCGLAHAACTKQEAKSAANDVVNVTPFACAIAEGALPTSPVVEFLCDVLDANGNKVGTARVKVEHEQAAAMLATKASRSAP